MQRTTAQVAPIETRAAAKSNTTITLKIKNPAAAAEKAAKQPETIAATPEEHHPHITVPSDVVVPSSASSTAYTSNGSEASSATRVTETQFD